MNISIIGTGYVGLVSGTCFAEIGNNVMCVDINKEKIDTLQKGEIPIYEPGLSEMVQRNQQAGRLSFGINLKEAVENSEIIFIAVGTPQKEYGLADLRFVYAAAQDIGKYLVKNNTVIVNKSTVPVGTALEVKEIIGKVLEKRQVEYTFSVVSNPEFLKEGAAIDDFMKPDRIIVGVEEEWARKRMDALYAPFTKNGHQLFVMDCASAEMSKYAANALLACKISFINQIANLCEIVGADVETVREAVCADTRVGPHFLNPGCGYGGSCFPKDVQALGALAKKHGYTASLIEAIETVNEQQKRLPAKKIIKRLENLEGKKIAIWGLAFKPNTDDMREAPSINLIEKLLARGAEIHVYDPAATEEARKLFGERIHYSDAKYDILEKAEALVIVTEWAEFREPDFKKIHSLLKNPIIFDGRNMYSRKRMEKCGFEYYSIGRKAVKIINSRLCVSS